MASPIHIPASGYPNSLRQLRKFTGFGDRYDYFRTFADRDIVRDKDDFLGDTINLDNWAVANGGGAGVASFAINVQRDGWIRGTAGTAGDATASVSAIGPAIWYGAANAYFEARFKDAGAAVTETMIEMGWIDVVPGSNKAAVNSVATPSVNTSVVEAALYHYRDASSTVTNQLITIGTAIAAQKTNFTPNQAIAAAKSNTVGIQLIKTASAKADVLMWFNGVLVAHHILGMTGDVALAPWLYFQRTTGTTAHLDVDYVKYWQDRDFASTGLTY
jgi:hypothetical protein